MRSHLAPGARHQRGLTLIELLVALTISLLVAIAAVATLIAGRTGFATVDATSQLVDRERFALDTLSKVIAQVGFEDVGSDALMTRSILQAASPTAVIEPDLFGWNDAIFTLPAAGTSTISGIPAATINHADRNTKCGGVTDTSCRNGSDILVVRFQGSSLPSPPAAAGTPDGTVINCRGLGVPGLIGADLNTRAINAFYVARDASTGEPGLYCAYYDHVAAAWVAGQALIDGVETFQVLYGTDNVTPASTPPVAGSDTIVDRWLRADQLVGPLPADTRENFRRVRAVRIGMVFRGPPGSAQERATASLAPLGSPTYVASADRGSQLDVAADGRLRRVANFTIHIHNNLAR